MATRYANGLAFAFLMLGAAAAGALFAGWLVAGRPRRRESAE
jgi:hypothetical protein